MSRSSPSPSTSGGGHWRGDFVPEEIWIDEDDNMTPCQEKAESKDIDLYDELLGSDMKSSEKTQAASDYEDLQKEILHLKSLVAEKESKLTTMTQHYTNVKKNICSLYKTAKIEIDHKDSLLAEANSKLDKVLFQRNLTVEDLEKSNHNKSFKSRPKEDSAGEGENHKKTQVPSKSHSSTDKKAADHLPSKRKRSSSPLTPPSGKKSARTENFSQDKIQNCEIKGASQNANSVIKDNLNKKQNDSAASSMEINKTGDAKANQDISNSKMNNSNPNCDLNSEQSSAMYQEPSIVEVFARMQELAFKDPEATNAVFFNLLPSELRDSFLDFERTQVNALNKLKQSFVSCYFAQCNSARTPEESSGNKPPSSTAFFFPDNFSKNDQSCSGLSASDSVTKHPLDNSSSSKTDCSSGFSATNKHSDPAKELGHSSTTRTKKSGSLSAADKHSDSEKELVLGHSSTTQTKKSWGLSVTEINSDSVKRPSSSKSSKSKRGNSIGSYAVANNSDSKSKSQETVIEENEEKKQRDSQRTRKKSTRHKPPKQDVSLDKYKDGNLNLYTQRQLNRRLNR